VTVTQATAGNLNATVTGTVSAAQSGTWTVQPGNTANTTPWLVTPKGFQDSGGTDITDTTNHALKVNIVAGAGSGGTASTIGSATPSQGTAAGFSDGTNMQLARVFDGDSGAGTQYSLGVLLKTPASGGAVDIGVAGTPLRVDPTGATAQPVTGTFWQTTQPISGSVSVTGSVAVTGTFWQATQPVSGTVTVTQGTAANLNATVTGTVAATQSGTWNINNISGTVSLPTGAATSANQTTVVTQGSATSGQNGQLQMGAVTTGAPAYTTAQSSPLSLTTTGNLRVDGSSVTQPVSGTFWQATQPVSGTVAVSGSVAVTGTFWQATQPVSIASPVTVAQATAANLNATVTGTVAATQSGTWTVQQGTPPWTVGGDTASGATDSGNPIKVGGIARTATFPTAVTTGQRVNAMFDKSGRQVVVGSQREAKGSQKTSITTATETTVVTAFASYLIDVYAIVVTNKSATTVFVDFRYQAGGSVILTLAAPANDTRGFTVPVDSAIGGPTTNTAWTAQVSSAVTSIEITMLYALNQ
jgi:hypothetical protein